MNNVAVVIPNWNGMDSIGDCLDSLAKQSLQPHVIVVENGSTDGSLEFLRKNYPDVQLVVNQRNLGFAGGVNSGIKQAIEDGFEFIALLNNDAVAHKDWLKHLVTTMRSNNHIGIVTCKMLSADGSHMDSTGDLYTVWGLPYPRGRGEDTSDVYDTQTTVFSASGGASLYRVRMLQAIGLFDTDFFAYYEDVDISFRAQLADWRIQYVPKAMVYHQIGATSGKIRGFTTYQTMKNLPWLLTKNVPKAYLGTVIPRFLLAYTLFFGRAVLRGQGLSALRGLFACLDRLPAKLRERKSIQHGKPITNEYIWQLMTHDLPPNAANLRKLRSMYWRILGKS